MLTTHLTHGRADRRPWGYWQHGPTVWLAVVSGAQGREWSLRWRQSPQRHAEDHQGTRRQRQGRPWSVGDGRSRWAQRRAGSLLRGAPKRVPRITTAQRGQQLDERAHKAAVIA